MSAKRIRTPSPSTTPTPKASRIADVSTSKLSRSLLCTLPPTCNPPKNQPTQLSSSDDLERHYATHHAHVCEERGCGCVFPDARLFELHQTECHDPLAAVKKDRGEKIFACHLVSCNRLFLTPKARRLHLIQAHGYPKEYFFAVTNKGVGGLLKRWGEGASMIRGEWKRRDGRAGTEDSEDSEGEDTVTQEILASIDTEEATPRGPIHDSTLVPSTPYKGNHNPTNSTRTVDSDLDALADSMTSLSLVPSSVRFGRGGKAGGFGPRGRGGHIPQQPFHTVPRGRGAMASTYLPVSPRGILPASRSLRGRGAPRAGFIHRARGGDMRGRGRGRG